MTSGCIFYAPPAGFTNTDTFTHLVTDGLSAPVSGVVTVRICVDDGITGDLTITSLGDGSFLITGSGIPGLTYATQ